MALVSQCKCEHPKLVHNKYTGNDVLVSCGDCLSCKRARQSSWSARLQQEAKCHLFSYEIELDYEEWSLPKYDFAPDGCGLIEVTPRLEKYYRKYPHLKYIPFSELKFKNKSDYDYFLDRLNGHHTCIPHASVYDIQLFKKRLNTYINREITGKYQNFRSAFASELGSQTFRSHVHGILFFEDERIKSRIEDLVDRAWRTADHRKLGHSKAAPDRGQFASYLSKYVCKPADLPSFYEHPALRNFFLTSRKPPIGSLFESSAEVRYIFNSASPQRVEFTKQGEMWIPKLYPIGKSYENRLFPKCVSYSTLNGFERAQLYKCAIVNDDVLPFDKWCNYIFNRIFVHRDYPNSNKFGKDYEYYIKHYFSGDYVLRDSDFARLLYTVSRQFENKRSFESLYSVSKRVYLQSKLLNVSVEYYITRILKYHDLNKPKYLSQRFYETASEVSKRFKDYDWKYFYPLTYLNEGYAPNIAPDARLYFANQHFKYKESMKKKEQNRYKDGQYLETKLKYRDPNLYQILTKYHAQKCNENVEAESQLWT